jgi:diguanylate cyclase (GGDEF)-like protein
VQAAERRAVRRAVTAGALVLAAIIAADIAVHLVVYGSRATPLIVFEGAAVVLNLVAAFVVRRGIVRSEAVALAALTLACAVPLFGLSLLPSGRVLDVAQLTILLVGTGLFLPWSQRWHIAGMAACMLMAVAFVVSPLGQALVTIDQRNLLLATALAGVTSAAGHAIWQSRVRGMLEQQFALRHLSRYSQRQEAHVNELNRELNHVARRDALTGIGNRFALDEAIAGVLDQGDRLRPRRFALVLLDIDHFKKFNDEHGHLAGDAALGRLGEILRRATRNEDRAFRYGGEEFLLLLPDVDLTAAIAVAERVRSAVAEDSAGGVPPFSISGGVALGDPADGRDPQAVLRRADAALYLAKRAGRNRIVADELSVAMQRQEIASA